MFSGFLRILLMTQATEVEVLHEDAEKGASIYPSITTHIPLHGVDHYPSKGGQEICAP
jgi:hypothetical protein